METLKEKLLEILGEGKSGLNAPGI
jgi:hypothetical protein